MADSIIVGQFVGSSALAAVGACAALTNVFIYWDTGQLLVFIKWRLIVSGWHGIAVSIVTESVFMVCQCLRCDSAQHRTNSCSDVGDADHAGDLVLAILVD